MLMVLQMVTMVLVPFGALLAPPPMAESGWGSASQLRSCGSLSPAICQPSSCGEVVATALRSCSSSGGGVVRMLAGTYHLNDTAVPYGQPMISLRNISDVALEGSSNGSRSILMIHGYRTGVQFIAASRISLRSLDLEMARYPYTFGTATEPISNSSFELEVDPALYPFRAPSGASHWQYEASSIMGFDRKSWRMASDPIVDLQGVYPIHASTAGRTRIVVSGAGLLEGVEAGRSYVLRHAQLGCGGFCFASCNSVLLNDVNVWTAAGVAYWFGSSRDITLQTVRVRRRPGRPMSSIADASHFDSCGGALLVVGNRFEGQGDDGMNVHSSVHEVRSKDPHVVGRLWLGSKPSAGPAALTPLTVGGRYKFRKRKTFEVEATAILRAVSVANGSTPNGAVVPTQVADFDFASAAAAARVSPFSLLADMSAEPTSVIVRGGYFGSNRARGALLKSSNTVVEDTIFDHTAAHCVQAYPDGCYWFEGDAFNSWVLRNNTFIGCGSEAMQPDVFVAACAPTWQGGLPLETPSTGGPVTNGQPFSNITIEGNRFEQALPHAALQLFGANGLRVVNNTVRCGNYAVRKRKPAIDASVQYQRPTSSSDGVSGHLDSVDIIQSGGTLIGWVVDQELTPGPVSSNVSVSVDGVIVAKAVANALRPDLIPAIATQPQHGFHISLSRSVAADLLSMRAINHSVVVSAIRLDGSKRALAAACVGAFRPTCGLPPDWRGVHPSSCACQVPWPARLQVYNSKHCHVEGNFCNEELCRIPTAGCAQ
eukprot:SAG31_NODE_678_length_12892_cov_5.458063_1_plen_769_part_00